MRFMREKLVVILAVLLVVSIALIGCGNSEVSTQEQTSGETGGPKEEKPKELVKWRHGTVMFKADSGFQLMAKEKGFFEKHGVEIEHVEFEGDATMLQALVAGEIDSMEANPASTISAVEKGAGLKIIGSTIPGLPYALYVNKDINSFADLRGKDVGVSKPGAFPEMVLKAMMDAEGVDPNSVNLVNAGSDAQRQQALIAGKIDAVANSSEFVPMAEKDGYKVLAYAIDVVPEYPRFVIVANEDSLKEKSDAAVGFLAAEMEGLTYAHNHKDEALKLTAKTIDVEENDEKIVSMYDEIKSKGYLSTECEIPYDKIEWLQDFLHELGRVEEKTDIDDLTDGSYREEALKIADLEQ